MFEDIQKHRQAVRENIEKSLQIGFTESEDFEKAHQVGDIHPNGKWVWTQLPSGKFDWRVIKNKQAKSTDDTQSDDKVKLTEGDFKKGVVEKDEHTRKNAIDLHDYTSESIEQNTNNGEKKKAQPYISEFYNSAKQDAVGGYEAYFDRADSIGTFRTLKEAISALETWINNMRVKGHAKPEWIYNESRGRYQMNYRFN